MDLSLFGYHTVQDSFGARICQACQRVYYQRRYFQLKSKDMMFQGQRHWRI